MGRQMCRYREGARKEALSIFYEQYPLGNQESPKELFYIVILKAWETAGFSCWCFCLEDQNNFTQYIIVSMSGRNFA